MHPRSGTTPEPARVRPQLKSLLLALPLAFASPLVAQTAPQVPATPTDANASSTSSAGDVVVLTPFEVSSDLDRGYRAGGTLAGTRLRLDLRDVAASVSVVTKDFLKDIAATDAFQALTYTLGTEVNGPTGNYSNARPQPGYVDFAAYHAQPMAAIRVRGLDYADTTRDYFLTDIPFDTFNTDRVEISRGANAMLFGLGSPSGIVNNNLIKADLNRNKTTVGFEADTWGSLRETLDTNYVLIPRKLSLRVAALYKDQYYKQKPAYVREKRLFPTLTFKPFDHTTIRVNAEFGRQHSNRPNPRPPYDGYTQWYQMGMPVWDPTTQTGHMLGTPVSAAVAAFNPDGSVNTRVLNTDGLSGALSFGLTAVQEDPTVSHLGITGLPADVQAVKFWNTNAILVNGKLANAGDKSYARGNVILGLLNGGPTDPRYSFWTMPQVTDTRIFDFYHHMLEGPNKYQWANWNAYNATIEQTALHGNVGIELAYDYQDLNWGQKYWAGEGPDYQISLDINTKLPNGLPNPNFLRPYVGARSFSSSVEEEREAYRATAYGKYDFTRNVKSRLGWLLGSHQLTLNYTDQEHTSYNRGGPVVGVGLDLFDLEKPASTAIAMNAGRRTLAHVFYMGPSVAGSSDPSAVQVTPITAEGLGDNLTSVKALYIQPVPNGSAAPNAPVYKSFSLIQSGHEDVSSTAYAASLAKAVTKSESAILNSKWFDDTIVTTLGARRDRFETSAWYPNGPSYDPTTGAAISDRSLMPLTPDLATTINTTSYGIVAHVPASLRHYLHGADLSLTYNSSDNFRPSAQRYNIDGSGVGMQTGGTKEYGALLTLFDDRFELRATHYRSTSALATNAALLDVITGIPRTIRSVVVSNADGTNNTGDPMLQAGIAAWNQWLGSATGQGLVNLFNMQISDPVNTTFDARYGTVVATSDTISQGWEYEAVINPTKYWRIAVNGADETVVRNNTGRQLKAMLDALAPVWGTGPASVLSLGNNNANISLKDAFQPLVNATNAQILQDGGISSELRRWHWNAVTRYRFHDNFLEGWSIGGAVRWLDKIALGFPVVVGPAGPQPDVTHPFYGPTEINYDAFVGYEHRFSHVTWDVQLNVRNIGVQDKLIPVTSQPDGTVGTYRIADPMTWVLSSSLSF